MKRKEISMEHKVLVGCIFSVQKFKADGRITYQGPRFHNLILDVGLDLIFDHSMRDLTSHVNVGEDNTAPAVSQTGLLSYLASTNSTYGSASNTGQSTDPAHNTITKTFEFAIGNCTGNLTEVGLSVDANTDYFNRQLFKDSQGDPTTITVLSDEGLRITAELSFYSDLQQGETEAGSFDLDGVSKGYTREMNVDAFTDTSGGTYTTDFSMRFKGGNLKAAIDEGTSLRIGDIPSPVSDENTTASYGTGNFYADAEFVWKAGTFVGDINRLILGYDGSGAYDKALSTFILDSPITLADTEQLTLNFRRSWGRYAA